MTSAATATPEPYAAAPILRTDVSRFKLWLALLGLAAAGLLLATPFFFPLVEQALARMKVPIPMGVALALQLVQPLMLCGLMAAVGVWCAPSVGLDAPLLRARLAGERVWRRFLGLLPTALLWGTLSSGAVLLLSLAFKSHLPAGGSFPDMPVWRTATAAFYGGIVEELLCRWGLLSLFAFLLAKLGMGRTAGFWAANALSALAFAASHLQPAAALGMHLTPPVVAYVLLGNSLVGLVFGWLFRRRGLECAMLAHGSADLWLHTVFPVFGL
jgi:membrane protease YdiL (CAAX protease family)